MPHGSDRWPRTLPAPGGGTAQRVAGATDADGEYELPGGARGRATGRLFVRFADVTAKEGARRAIDAAGLRVVDEPPYAPTGFWLGPGFRGAAAAAAAADAIATLPGVVALEAEIVRPRAKK
ncbi:MAG TPA: hypothetical protein VEI02_13810 [Planctomycetota bacterium]|nr:hypothetical protein [Planctomycetota bacterium]